MKLAGDWVKLQKTLFAQAIVDKIKETMSKNKAKLERKTGY